MGTIDKLIIRFCSLPADFTWDELTRMLKYFGYEMSNKGKSSGSRIIFKNEAKKAIMLHKPHPGNILKMYALKQIYTLLKAEKLIK